MPDVADRRIGGSRLKPLNLLHDQSDRAEVVPEGAEVRISREGI
jgi:hypothetical protein